MLNGTGQLFLDPECQAFTKSTTLTPSQIIRKNISQSLYIPIKNKYNAQKSILANGGQKLLESYNFTEAINIGNLKDLERHSKSLLDIESQIKSLNSNEKQPNSLDNIYLLASLLVVSTMLVTLVAAAIFAYKYKSKTPILYQPHDVIAETPI